MLSMTLMLAGHDIPAIQKHCAVLAGIKNQVSREQNRPFKRSPHCEKGRSAYFSGLFDWIYYFTILSGVYATDTCSSEKAHKP